MSTSSYCLIRHWIFKVHIVHARTLGGKYIVLLNELEFHIVYSHDLAENQFENLENIINKDRR